jgi:hypothetical protein
MPVRICSYLLAYQGKVVELPRAIRLFLGSSNFHTDRNYPPVYIPVIHKTNKTTFDSYPRPFLCTCSTYILSTRWCILLACSWTHSERHTNRLVSFSFGLFAIASCLEKNLLNSPNDNMREHLRKDSVDIKTTIPDMFQIIFHTWK